MTAEPRPPQDDFEIWLLRRTAEAVEACEVSEALLREVQAELRTQGEASLLDHRELAVRQLEDLGGVSKEDGQAALEMMEEYPEGIRNRFVRWLAERWLESHRRAYRRRHSE